MVEKRRKSMKADQKISDRAPRLVQFLYLIRQSLARADQGGELHPEERYDLFEALRITQPAMGIASMNA